MNLLPEETKEQEINQWNFIYIFLLIGVVFFLIGTALVRLQIVEGSNYATAADNNEIELSYEYPKRGVIYDRDGNVLAENIAATDLFLELDHFFDDDVLNEKKLDQVIEKILEITKGEWNLPLYSADLEGSISERIVARINEMELEQGIYVKYSDLLIFSDISNEETIKIKAERDKLPGVKIVEGNKRTYPGGVPFSHILGYIGIITADDLESIDYLGYDDFLALNGYKDKVGKTGLEKVYDKDLIGEKGINAIETDVFGNEVSELSRSVDPVENGKNLHLSISSKAQNEMYKVLVAAVEKYNATGGVGIVEDVQTGELLTMVSVPSYDNNSFIGGISQADYNLLLNNPQLPLLDRTISAQLPPGSTFKTIAAVGALDSGAINLNTIYVSRSNYTFSNGAPFQEYRGSAYGGLNIIGAITKSSNIFFCETIRNWDINELVEYYEGFGIGSPTNVDLLGEMPGRLPSPENKIELANTPGITWLDPIWYPEGDGCNTVIGQGITLVTPLQMVNWISAIANGGTLNNPHLAVKLSDAGESEKKIEFDQLNKDFVSESALKTVRQGMRNAVAGDGRTIYAFTTSKLNIAAKTGTAEFGAVNEKGIYEHTHAWVTGFFPYDDPKYAFVFLLEDGGESYYAAEVARGFLDWWEQNMGE